MNWTNEKPTKPGWYWFNPSEGAGGWWTRLGAFELWEDGRCFLSGVADPQSLDDADGQFAGPIPEPTDKPGHPVDVFKRALEERGSGLGEMLESMLRAAVDAPTPKE